MSETLNIITAVLTGLYGLGLVFGYNFFMGTYIGKDRTSWDRLMESEHKDTVKHIVIGCGLSWIWISLLYFNLDRAALNIIIWVLWVALDNVVRFHWKLYNRFSTVANGLMCTGMLIAWIVNAAT